MFRFVVLSFVLLGLQPVGAVSNCVQVAEATLYKEPSEAAEVSWQVVRYMPLDQLRKKNGWYQVKDLLGRTHWIKETEVTHSFECAVISNEFAFLRTGPGTNFPKFSPVPRGERFLAFRVIEKRADWVKLEDPDGDRVWIHRPLLWIPK